MNVLLQECGSGERLEREGTTIEDEGVAYGTSSNGVPSCSGGYTSSLRSGHGGVRGRVVSQRVRKRNFNHESWEDLGEVLPR